MRTHQFRKVFAAFADTHKPIQESFRPPFSKGGAFRLRKAIKRRIALVALRVRAKCSRTVCTERCKYPVSALAERGCESERVVGGRHRIYFNFDITICAVRFFFAKLFLCAFFCQRKSVKRFSGSKSVAFGNVMHSLREHDVTAKPS